MVTIGGKLSWRFISWKNFQGCLLGHVHSRMCGTRSSQVIEHSANHLFLTSNSRHLRHMHQCGTSNNFVNLKVKYFSNVLTGQSNSSEPLLNTHSQDHHSSDKLWMDTGTAIDRTHHISDRALESDQRRNNPMDIEELVEFLWEENASDICAINVPLTLDYVNYFVVCSGFGARHLRRMADGLVAEV